MSQNISTDKAVESVKDDKFQRSEFSKRIAQRIISTGSNDSVVIGIYGEWGEGKTSIINFIEEELKTDEDIIPIRFNPWRFGDETALLISFFNTLALRFEELKNHLDKGNPLATNMEVIGSVLEKYGGAISAFGVGKVAETIGENLAKVNVEDLKKRFEEALINSGKKLVIFIDDIDRLEKSEIHSIFRLVKLTADFSNTFYVLSFDPNMVAAAIGERFGEGNEQAGHNFLEKIIQVPLEIPVAQSKAIVDYCYSIINNVLKENNIELCSDDAHHFATIFEKYVLIRLRTPRMAIRYCNILSFSLSLLKGEANMVDLMLIEAVKVFYPKHYEFIKENPEYFKIRYSTDYRYKFANEDSKKKAKEIIEYFNELAKGLTIKETECIKSLLIELFPSLGGAFSEGFFREEENNEWYKNKKIASPHYFKRYFSYSVLKGEISDVDFDTFMTSINNTKSEDEIIESNKRLIETSSIEAFLIKMQMNADELKWETSKQIALSIALMGDVFKDEYGSFTFGLFSNRRRAINIICQIVRAHDVNNECLEFSKNIICRANPLSFACDILAWLSVDKTEKIYEEKLFTKEQFEQLEECLINRALSESKDASIFEVYPDEIRSIFNLWKDIDYEAVNKYIKNRLDKHPEKVKDFLVALTPTISSSLHPEPYKSNLKKENFDFLIQLIEVEYICKIVVREFGDEIDKAVAEFSDEPDSQTDLNVMRQFKHWYLIDKESAN